MAREPHTGGLHLPKDVGIGKSDVDAIRSQWDTVDRVDARLKQLGMLTNELPDIAWQPISVEVLVTTDIKEYTRIFAAQLRWLNYANRLLADVRAKILQVDNQMEDIATEKRGHFRSRNEGELKRANKLSKDEMEDLILQDPSYKELRLTHQELEQTRMKVAAWVDELDSSLKTISRQIENRKAEGMGGQREQNMPGHASGRWERHLGKPAGGGT